MRSLSHTSLLEPLRTSFGCKQDLFYLNSFHTMFWSYYFSSLKSSQISPPSLSPNLIFLARSLLLLSKQKRHTQSKQTAKKEKTKHKAHFILVHCSLAWSMLWRVVSISSDNTSRIFSFASGGYQFQITYY